MNYMHVKCLPSSIFLSLGHTVTIVATTAHEWATINRRP